MIGKNMKIDSNNIISNNPFDVLTGNAHLPTAVECRQDEIKREEMSDEGLLSFIKKPKVKTEPKIKKPGIVNKMRIKLCREVEIKSRKYYRFPLSYNIKNDGSEISQMILKEFSFAIHSAYRNYRKFGESFKVVMGSELVEFGEEVKCSFSFRDVLEREGVEYVCAFDCLVVDKREVAILYDVIANMEILRSKCFPFVFSAFEFDGGIVYHTKVERGPVVHTERGYEYFYLILGPLWTEDFQFPSDSLSGDVEYCV